MTLSSPMPFREALRRQDVRRVMPTRLSTAELRELDRAITDRAFYSARNTIGQALEELKKGVREILNPETRTRIGEDGQPERYTAGTNRATVRLKVKGLYDSLGYAPEPGTEGSLLDHSSSARIDLVIKTNVEVAQGYGAWRAGQDEGVLDEWPAQELFRAEDREEERDWLTRFRLAGQQSGREDGWTVEGGRMIALKNHPIWDKLGDSALFDDGLGNPYPPFAFNSGMDVRDIDRDEAMALGLIDRDTQIEPRRELIGDGGAS